MEKRIVWLIDENEQQLTTYRNALRMLLPTSVEIRAIYPLAHKEDLVSIILENAGTSCIVIDQKLKDTGIATYYGTDLAKYFRSIDKKVPIYILTNHVNDDEQKEQFAGSEWSVEDIIPKGALSDDHITNTLVPRMVRRIDVYEDLLESREQRFSALLSKSVNGDLSDEELEELDALQGERTAATMASEIYQLDELEQVVTKYRLFLEQFKETSKDQGVDNNNARA